MKTFNNSEVSNLMAAKASVQPLCKFPVDQLPLGLRDSLSGVSEDARVPALFAALPIAAAYADGVKALYCDGDETPMALMSIIIGEQASGKGVCRRIESIWAQQMDKDDELPREQEAWYQENKGKRGVVDPKPCIRHIGDIISKSALMRRQLCADGHTLYMFSEELSSMKSAWRFFNDYFRKSFDHSLVSRDYITATSGLAKAQVNFTGCCTPNIFQKFFSDDNIEDGSSSRMMLAKMPDTSFAPLTQRHGYTDEEKENIQKAVRLLETSHGVVDMPQMREEFCTWLEAKRQLALANADRVMDVYRRRSAVIGFRCGVIFHLLEQQKEESEACIRFALAVADYVLAMQMEMFGQRLDRQQKDNDIVPIYKSRNNVLFEELPEQFTLLDASRARRDGAGKETLRKMVYRWVKRGLCERVEGEAELWQKLPLTA